MDLSEQEVGERDGWIKVGSGAFAPRAEDDADGGAAHAESKDEAAECGIGKEGDGGRGGIEEECRAEAGSEHEDGELGAFHEVEGPVFAKDLEECGRRDGGAGRDRTDA